MAVWLSKNGIDIRVITNPLILTFDPNFQRDIQVFLGVQ